LLVSSYVRTFNSPQWLSSPVPVAQAVRCALDSILFASAHELVAALQRRGWLTGTMKRRSASTKNDFWGQFSALRHVVRPARDS
jgi:hypothetical protein